MRSKFSDVFRESATELICLNSFECQGGFEVSEDLVNPVGHYFISCFDIIKTISVISKVSIISIISIVSVSIVSIVYSPNSYAFLCK